MSGLLKNMDKPNEPNYEDDEFEPGTWPIFNIILMLIFLIIIMLIVPVIVIAYYS